jgi:hypothetical protein
VGQLDEIHVPDEERLTGVGLALAGRSSLP